MAGPTPNDAPFITPAMAIAPDWIDYNGHLNMAYYLVVFDRASDIVFAALGMGPDYAAARAMTTYTAEAHIAYLREVHADAQLVCDYQILDHDEKRIHGFQRMRHATQGWLAATCETLTLHVDRSGPRVAPFPADIAANVAQMAERHALLPRPDGAGRAIAMRRRPTAPT
ncbi:MULTISPECIES: thioesterase family protein [unclassified Roseitalea]|uniref:thioesterase family protein n=1 Tax=unclassified Roseitalea TaxID=2639107 RepID=UPI00273D03B5|nr:MULTISPECIES: thioesterase family protein [unclassified Roseitalea]